MSKNAALLLTRQETATLLRVSLRTLDRWRHEGILLPVPLGEGIRTVRYRRADVEQLIAAGDEAAS